MTTSKLLAWTAAGLLALGACGDDETKVQPKASTGSTSSGAGGAGGSATLPEPMNHRAMAETCTGEPPPGSAIPMEPNSACEMDSECTDGTNGRCVWPYGGGNVCMYDECFEDEDCGGASVCRCRGEFGFNRCYQGNCVTDADCPDSWCSPSIVGVTCMSGISPGSIGYFCRTVADECVGDSDCAGNDSEGCIFSVDSQSWICHELLCTG